MQKSKFIKLVRTADLIKSGYGHLTSGQSMFTFVNASWLDKKEVKE